MLSHCSKQLNPWVVGQCREPSLQEPYLSPHGHHAADEEDDRAGNRGRFSRPHFVKIAPCYNCANQLLCIVYLVRLCVMQAAAASTKYLNHRNMRYLALVSSYLDDASTRLIALRAS